MTKQEIIAELRRSACEDANPYLEVKMPAWYPPFHMSPGYTAMKEMKPDNLRIFFLLVAAAMESESKASTDP